MLYKLSCKFRSGLCHYGVRSEVLLRVDIINVAFEIAYSKFSKPGLDIKINSIFLAKRLDVRHYPTRNFGLSRRFVCESRVPSTLKCMAGIKLANITAYAVTLVILSGDVL